MKKVFSICISLVLFGVIVACSSPDSRYSWLKGKEAQRIDKVAEHLRGNDLVMWEVRYRHLELYNAIVDSNTELALYQLKKIELAMRMGMERRPKRSASYEWFFSTAINPMKIGL